MEILSSSTRTAKQQYWDGLDLYCDCIANDQWPRIDEERAMTPAQKRGWQAAQDAAAEAATPGYAESMGW